MLSFFLLLLLTFLFVVSNKKICEPFSPVKVVLVGDSILNHEKYHDKDFASRLRKHCSVLQLARDGMCIPDFDFRIEIPPDSIVVLSLGGNDLLQGQPNQFTAYKNIVSFLQKQSHKLIICDVYFPPCLVAGNSILRNQIQQWNFFLKKEISGKMWHLSSLLTEKEDFTACIEPSESGAAKMTAAFCRDFL